MISGLYTKENNHSMTMSTAVNTIALDPIYARSGSGRRFMTGELPIQLTPIILNLD
jgi:hypothetical protein